MRVHLFIRAVAHCKDMPMPLSSHSIALTNGPCRGTVSCRPMFDSRACWTMNLVNLATPSNGTCL